MNRFFYSLFVISALAVALFAQDPAPSPGRGDTERVIVEEIKLNVAGFEADGRPVVDLSTEDFVIIEDGRLHRPGSVRRVPASVLIVMDTGIETKQRKNISTTLKAADNILAKLEPETQIALMQYNDRVKFLAEWTSDKDILSSIIKNKTGFGRRSAFTAAMNGAIEFMQNAPTENRHLVLITDGLDSEKDQQTRVEMARALWRSGIVVHVLSYTQIEFGAVKGQAKIWRGGEQNPNRMPEEVAASIKNSLPSGVFETIFTPRLLTVVVDIPYLGDRRSLARALKASNLQLSAMAEISGGEYIVPENLEEVEAKASLAAAAINSQFVATYIPARSLAEVQQSEVRRIEVLSRRSGLNVYAKRILLVLPK